MNSYKEMRQKQEHEMVEEFTFHPLPYLAIEEPGGFRKAGDIIATDLQIAQQRTNRTPRNPHFHSLLNKMREVHDSKSHDYAKDSNPFSNFEFAGSIASGFTDPTDISFAVLIGVKLARLQELLGSGKTPKNEALEDTMLDLSNYCAIWTSYHLKKSSLKYASEVGVK